MRSFLHKKLYYLFFLIFLIPALFTISDYNVNWDEAEHFRRGQAILHYFLTGKTNYNDLPHFDKFQAYLQDRSKKSNANLPRYSFFQNTILNGDHYLHRDNGGHPPLGGILTAFTNYIFYQKLGILGDVESYHFLIIIAASLLVFLISYWVYKEYGTFASLISTLSLTLTPLFFAESHANIKDPLQTTFFALTLYVLYKGIIKEKKLLILLSSLFFGVAFATKFNILFLPFVIFPWLLIYYGKNVLRLKKFFLAFIPYPFIAFSVFFLSWPFLWFDFPKRVLTIFGYYKTMGASDVYSQPSSFYFLGFNTYPWQTVLFTTPLIILFLSFFGIIYVFLFGIREKNKTSVLILLWLLVPIIRVTLPGTSIYGGVRQIMEYVPALAILSGIGAKYLVTWLHSYIVKIKPFSHLTIQPFQLLVILSFIPIALKIISIHPNENVYFNPLIGGLKEAKGKNYPYWGLNLGSSYKQGIDWLNKNAEKNASVALVLGTADNIPRISFREDLIFYNGAWSGTERKGEYLIEAIFDGWIREWYHAGEYVDKILRPVYEVKVDDVAILKVWKNDKEHTYSRFLNEMQLDPNQITWRQEENSLIIDIKEILELMSISVTVQNENCFDLKTGQVFLSLDNKTWQLEKEPIRSMFKSGSKLTYPLVAKKARYVKMEIDKTSCLFDIEKVGISYIKS